MRYFLILIVFAVVVAVSTAQAETKHTKHYGNCVVTTDVDVLTDEELHIFTCQEGTSIDLPSISLISNPVVPLGLRLVLSTGIQFHPAATISIALRVDKGPVIRRDALWNSQSARFAILDEPALTRPLLHHLAHGQRLVIEVGDERGIIRLDGSRLAIEDFRQRSGLQVPQTLEIPVHN